MHKIDTHLHLWDPARFPYSWCAGIPSLNRAFTVDDYLAAAEGSGITKALFMECDVDEPHSLDEALWVQGLAETHPFIAGIVAAARPGRDDFPEQLEALLRIPKLRGIRRVLHVADDATSQTALFAEHLRQLGGHGLTFDICMLARQLPLARTLAERCPGTTFILDHCGIPDIKSGTFEPWAGDLRAIAELPHVMCKISGIIAYAAEDWTVSTLRPWVEHVVDCFGWDRIVWGGDWPVCTLGGTLRRWADATDELFAGVSESRRAALLHANAERIYQI
jgi:predicted TIM-barrel fold metal-dependent hydrolase